MTQQQLASQLSCDKVQVVRIINYLSSKGYVERIQHPEDKRKYELSTTEKAKKIMPDVRKAIQEASAITLKGFSEVQIDELYKTLSKIENNLIYYKSHSAK